jgi:hypothetical protein
MRLGAAQRALTSAVLGGLLAATPATGAEEARVKGCTVRLVSVDAKSVPTFRGECVWSVAPAWVATVLTDPRGNSSMLKSTQRLEDGRVVNVQRTGWPFDDRQSTIVIHDVPLPGGGVRRRYRLADTQAPLAEGAVQVSVDEGSWEVTSHPDGVRVVVEMSYEPGGNLPASLVHSMSPKYIARALDELRVSAEKLARHGAPLPSVASGPPQD